MDETVESGKTGKQYRVVVNDEGQYSIWPVGRELPNGWSGVDHQGTEESCVRYIDEVWTDMRPRSVR